MEVSTESVMELLRKVPKPVFMPAAPEGQQLQMTTPRVHSHAMQDGAPTRKLRQRRHRLRPQHQRSQRGMHGARHHGKVRLHCTAGQHTAAGRE